MTISEKSTELGIDLAQIALDNHPIMTVKDGVTDAFKCYCAGGEGANIYIKDNNGIQIGEWNMNYRYSSMAFTESTPLATIQADFLTYINGLEFIPLPVQDVVTPKE